MELKNLIIHKLEKKQGGNPKLTKAPKELTIHDVHTKFMDEVKEVYYKKSNPIYGVFDSAEESYPFQKFLNAYLNGKTSFYDFSVQAITHFQTVIKDTPQATGGYVLFCHFETTEEFVATIVLNDKESYMIGDNLDIKENARLDIEKLDVANFTNCSKWNKAEDVYLSFTRGKKDVSNYFKKFIGCTDYTSAKEASGNLKRALSDYFVQAGYDKKKVEEIKATVFSYCEQRMRSKEDISLGFVSSLVNHDEPELFREFASTENYQVSPVFKGHNTLRSLKYYSFRSKELTIVFDSKLLNESIVYDAKKESLLLKKIPESLRLQLTKNTPVEDSNE
jgi:nucleoid-associated protein YejK